MISQKDSKTGKYGFLVAQTTAKRHEKKNKQTKKTKTNQQTIIKKTQKNKKYQKSKSNGKNNTYPGPLSQK